MLTDSKVGIPSPQLVTESCNVNSKCDATTYLLYTSLFAQGSFWSRMLGKRLVREYVSPGKGPYNLPRTDGWHLENQFRFGFSVYTYTLQTSVVGEQGRHFLWGG